MSAPQPPNKKTHARVMHHFECGHIIEERVEATDEVHPTLRALNFLTCGCVEVHKTAHVQKNVPCEERECLDQWYAKREREEREERERAGALPVAVPGPAYLPHEQGDLPLPGSPPRRSLPPQTVTPQRKLPPQPATWGLPSSPRPSSSRPSSQGRAAGGSERSGGIRFVGGLPASPAPIRAPAAAAAVTDQGPVPSSVFYDDQDRMGSWIAGVNEENDSVARLRAAARARQYACYQQQQQEEIELTTGVARPPHSRTRSHSRQRSNISAQTSDSPRILSAVQEEDVLPASARASKGWPLPE